MIDDVKKALGEFAEDFNFTVEGVFIVARQKAFIDNKGGVWTEIARRMKSVGAERISTGKGDRTAHWRVPSDVRSNESSQQNLLEKLDRAIDVLQICLRDLNEVKKALKEK